MATDTQPAPAAYSLRKIVKRFPGVLANDRVDFEVGRGEIHALLGENGAGKSTLMQILYGQYGRDGGDILVDGRPCRIDGTRDAIRLGIGMIHQEFMLVRRFSVIENVVMGMDDSNRRVIDLNGAAARLRDLSREYGLHVDPHDVIEQLPIGVQQRVEILKLLYRNARLLILDEPTAVLTPQETASLFVVLRHLASMGHSVVIVTHKLHEILEISDRVTIMRDGRVVGSVATGQSSKDELARLMVGRDVNLRAAKSPRPAGRPILALEAIRAKDVRGFDALNGVDLTVHEGEILGIAGVDGNGQSELAGAIMGLTPVTGGRVLFDGGDVTRASPAAHHRKGLAYVPADRRHVGAVTDLPVHRNAILGRHREFVSKTGMMDEGRIGAFSKAMIERFGIRPKSPDYLAGKLSGGNLQKLILGREVMRDPRAIVIEQPTRGLDVGAIEVVWREIIAQRDAGKAILLISAELEEIFNLSDRIAVIYMGRIMGVVRTTDASMEEIGLMMAGESRVAGGEVP